VADLVCVNKGKDMKTAIEIQDLYRSDPVKACQIALKQTTTIPEHERLEAINKLLGTYGTEAIRGEWQNSYWCDIVAAYCNTGDTYAITVLQVRGDWSGKSSRFIVSNWGDFVEKHEKLYMIS
jgi:hypothetical protein